MKDKKSDKRVSSVLLLLIIATAFVSMGASWWPPGFIKRFTSSPLEAGTAAPQFKLETLNAKTISLEQFKGKPVLLDFWGTG